MAGFLKTRMDEADYRRFLNKRLCWLDGTRTHRSSGPQRQCPLCRTKWSYGGRVRNHLLLLEYCQGRNAGFAANRAFCSRNTAQTFFRSMDRRTTHLVRRMISTGGIAIATEPSTFQILKRLQKSKGRRTPAEAAARYLFFHGLDLKERVNLLSEPDIQKVVQKT